MRAVLILACLGLAACKATAEPQEPRPATYVRVIDGDTIVVRGEHIRIENIDAPELAPKSKCWAEAALALHAMRMMQGYINEAPALRIERSGKDRYGRTLARVYVRNADLGQALIGMGVASAWTGRRWDWCGVPNLKDANGPSFLQAPGGNDEFLDWATDAEDDRLEEAARGIGLELKPAR